MDTLKLRIALGLVAPSIGLWGILDSLNSGDIVPRVLGIVLIVAGVANIENLSYEMAKRWPK
jgi:uncharacterized membrane protein HdeD (DUF308 family)